MLISSPVVVAPLYYKRPDLQDKKCAPDSFTAVSFLTFSHDYDMSLISQYDRTTRYPTFFFLLTYNLYVEERLLRMIKMVTTTAENNGVVINKY